MAKMDKDDKPTDRPQPVPDATPSDPASDVELQRDPEPPAEGGVRALSLESLQALLKDSGVSAELRADVEAEIRGRLAEQEIDKQAILGRMSSRDRALFAFGLEERHVLALKEYQQEDGSVEVVILTHGGQRVRWPKDEGRVLSAMEKGDAVPAAEKAGIFPKE